VIALPGGAELDGSPLSIDRPAIRGYQRVAVGLALSDGMALTLAAALASWIVAPHRALTPVLLLDVAAWLAVFHLFGLYGIQHLSASEEFRRIISATSVGIAVVAIAASWWEPTLTRSWIACAWTLALLFQLAERRVWRKVVYWFRDRGWLAFRTLVVGTNEEAETLVRTMRGDRSLGFLPVGYLTTSERTVESDGVPVVGGIRNIDRAIREGGIECLFVASTAVTADEMYRVSRACRRANVEMRVSANLPEILTSRLTIQHIDRVMALSVRPVRLTRTQAVLKRSSLSRRDGRCSSVISA
jgi:FlaA1/EpsC-like NDP-sugar epimerase